MTLNRYKKDKGKKRPASSKGALSSKEFDLNNRNTHFRIFEKRVSHTLPYLVVEEGMEDIPGSSGMDSITNELTVKEISSNDLGLNVSNIASELDPVDGPPIIFKGRALVHMNSIWGMTSSNSKIHPI